MKPYRNILLVLFAFVLFLILPACGGGGGGGGTPVTGTKPVAIYNDNAVVVGTTATVSALVNPNGAGTYRFVLTDSLGGRQEKLPQSISGSMLQSVQAVFTGLNPVATNTATVEATNPHGTASDFGTFPTWSTPPAITGSVVINITRTSGEVVITVNPSLDPTLTEVFLRFGTDPSMNTYAETSQPVPAGVDNLVYAITGYTDNTLVYYWLATGHSWGYWVSQTAQSFTTLPPPGTVATPTFNPTPGTYTGPQSVAISSATAGASIRYTTDGTDPTSTTGTLYTAPVPVSSTTTLKAIAFLSVWYDSPVTTGTYTITLMGTGTINVGVYRGDNVVIFGNNVQILEMTAPADAVYTFIVPTRDIKGFYKNQPTGYRPFTIVDRANNNVFRLSAGGVLNWNYGVSNSPTTGKITYDTSGSGFIPLYQAPVYHTGTAWNQTETVYESTNNSVPVGTVATYTRSYTQNENFISRPSAVFGTVPGTVNGDLVYMYTVGSDQGWSLTWKEVWTVNSSGTSLTGTTEETWDMSGQPSAYVKANLVGTR